MKIGFLGGIFSHFQFFWRKGIKCSPPEDEVVDELPGDIMVTEVVLTSGCCCAEFSTESWLDAAAAVAPPAPAWTGLRMGLLRLFRWYR